MLEITEYTLTDVKHRFTVHVSRNHLGWDFWSDDLDDDIPLPEETYVFVDDALKAIQAWYETLVFEGDQS